MTDLTRSRFTVLFFTNAVTGRLARELVSSEHKDDSAVVATEVATEVAHFCLGMKVVRTSDRWSWLLLDSVFCAVEKARNHFTETVSQFFILPFLIHSFQKL